jgi:hypothetical protein
MKSLFMFTLMAAFCHGANASNPCEDPIRLTKQADYVYLQGRLCPGDGKRFIQYMSGPGKGVSMLRLNSGGGTGAEAVAIGRYVRANNMTTWTDGRQDKCASACNRIFVGGVRRIYSHANYIQTGKDPKQHFGLGYHHPNSNGDFLAAEDWYQKGIVPYLKEMLPVKAFNWIYKTDEGNLTPNMVWLNGAQALELGIATSSQPPQ